MVCFRFFARERDEDVDNNGIGLHVEDISRWLVLVRRNGVDVAAAMVRLGNVDVGPPIIFLDGMWCK